MSKKLYKRIEKQVLTHTAKDYLNVRLVAEVGPLVLGEVLGDSPGCPAPPRRGLANSN